MLTWAAGAGRLLSADLWPAADRNLNKRHIQFKTAIVNKSGVFSRGTDSADRKRSVAVAQVTQWSVRMEQHLCECVRQ